MNVKSQSELDIGGRETCSRFYWQVIRCQSVIVCKDTVSIMPAVFDGWLILFDV